MKIRPIAMIEQLTEKLDSTSNPRHQKLLQNVIAHVSAEIDGRDVNRILDTMVPEPQFHWYGMGYGDVGPKGREAVTAHYSKMLGERYHLHQHIFDTIMVDDNNVFLAGMIHIIFPGRVLKDMEFSVDDEKSAYAASYYSWARFRFDDAGNCLGEDSFSDGMPITLERLTKLRPDEMPEQVKL